MNEDEKRKRDREYKRLKTGFQKVMVCKNCLNSFERIGAGHYCSIKCNRDKKRERDRERARCLYPSRKDQQREYRLANIVKRRSAWREYYAENRERIIKEASIRGRKDRAILAFVKQLGIINLGDLK